MLARLKQRVSDMGTVRTLCSRAEAHARDDGQREPGAEHFLLAALDLPDGTAGRAFGRAGADPASLKAAIAVQYADALRKVGFDLGSVGFGRAQEALPGPATGLYEAAPSGRHVMQALAARRKFKEHTPLVGAHVVAVVASMEHGVAARALRRLVVDREALRLAAEEEGGALERQ